jgi:hypothetical protein
MDYRKMIAVVINDWLEQEGSGGPSLPDRSLTDEENAELGRISDDVYAAYSVRAAKRAEEHKQHIDRAIQEHAERAQRKTEPR